MDVTGSCLFAAVINILTKCNEEEWIDLTWR